MVRITKQELSPQILKNFGIARSDVSGSRTSSLSGEEAKPVAGEDINLRGHLEEGLAISADVHWAWHASFI